MAIFSYSTLLPEEEVQFLLDLLRTDHVVTPSIFIFDRWDTVELLTKMKNDLYQRYTVLKRIVNTRTFSTYNYKHNAIFIYLFNLPYENHFLIKLHGVFCLFHEMRHHQQFIHKRTHLLDSLSEDSPYSYSWAEKDANRYATKWMRRNRKVINDLFKLHTFRWDVGVTENNRLRIVAN